jgi:amino acid adenylation domain-containing protein
MATAAASSQEQIEQNLAEWNATESDYPKDRCVHQLFEERAQETPNATALIWGDQRFSYRELDERANQLGWYLQKLGVGPNELVGICMERSIDMIVALLGTLKAGGAYVPLDPAYPAKRLSSMVSEVDMKMLLTHQKLAEKLPGNKASIVCLDSQRQLLDSESIARPANKITPDSLAYVIFTSGSTGKAKAAGVFHHGWTNLMHWFVTEFNVTAQDRSLLVSSFSFDITQRSIAMPLIRGAELHLLASSIYDPGLILATIDKKQITLMNCAPSTLYPVIENPLLSPFQKLRSMRVLFLGGEAISATRLREWVESPECRAEIANVYGAAECSDVSSFYRLKDYARYVSSSVPIGKPIFNTQIYLLDGGLNLVPFGEAGEICIAGNGVGKGYINDPALTAEKFVQNPFSSEPRSLLYRTGDLARFLPDWNLEFIGRVDHQVKLRGYRIDLGDIEAALRQHALIREAVVLRKGYGPSDQRLIAYLAPKDKGTTRESLEDEVRPFLKDKLPEYMVPSEFLRVEEMPLNPNGKIDRSALLEMETGSAGVKIGAEEPRNATEKEVASILAQTLKRDRVGIYDNFFNIGGNSFLLTEVLVPLCVHLQTSLSIADFLAGPTVAQIAKRIEELKSK